MQAVCRHLAALGHYGHTALLAPMYGIGEISQSFCRIAAVNGGIYILKRGIRGLLIEGDRMGEQGHNQCRCVGILDTENKVAIFHAY